MSTTEKAQATIDTLQQIRNEIQNTLMNDSPPWWLDSTLETIEENVMAACPGSIAEAVELTKLQIEITE